MLKRQTLKLLSSLVIVSALALTGCQDKKPSELKVGATAGPHAANVQKLLKLQRKTA